MQIPLTPIALTALVNMVAAGLFAVIPTWRAWFISRSADEQTSIFGIGSIVLGIVLMAGTCAGLFSGPVCTGADLTTYFVSVVLSSIGGISAAKAAFVVVRLTDKPHEDVQKRGDTFNIPHVEREKMLSR